MEGSTSRLPRAEGKIRGRDPGACMWRLRCQMVASVECASGVVTRVCLAHLLKRLYSRIQCKLTFLLTLIGEKSCQQHELSRRGRPLQHLAKPLGALLAGRIF